MEYFKPRKNADEPVPELARRIVEIARLHDPEVKEFPNDPDEAAKLLYERVLKPTPSFNGNGVLNGFDDTLDYVAAKRLIQCACNLKSVEDPFNELKGYQQMKVFLEFVDGIRKHGWACKVVASRHGEDGEVKKVVKKQTGVHLRRVEAVLESISLVRCSVQAAFVSSGE